MACGLRPNFSDVPDSAHFDHDLVLMFVGMSPHLVHNRLGGALGKFSTPLSDVGRTSLQVEPICLSTHTLGHMVTSAGKSL